MTWPSGDPNQPPAYQQPGAQYPPPPPPPLPYHSGPYGPPPQYGQYGQPAGYPPAPKKSHRGLIIGLVIGAVVLLCALGAGVLFVVAKTQDKVGATDLALGQCITDIPNGSLVKSVPTVDCSKPHAGEVYAVLVMPDGEFPGQSAIDAYQNKCPGALQSYSTSATADESVGVFVLYPTAQTWAQGDRTVTCIATTDDKRTGSIKG